MYTLGHHNNMYPECTRYNENSKYIDRSQQYMPLIIITVCTRGSYSIMKKLVHR